MSHSSDERFRKRFLDCSGLSQKNAEDLGQFLAVMQRDISFWIGDLARYSESQWPDTHAQIWPEWISPGLLARTAGVSSAYPSEADRQHEATYTQYMQVAKKDDRQERLADVVGVTSDESRKLAKADTAKGRWLLAIDVNYYLHRFFYSGAGVGSAASVADWIERTVERLKEKGLTDCVCCFDSRTNHRKQLTETWEKPYKPRPAKEDELRGQLNSMRDLLEAKGLLCVSVDDMEADDVMASYAAQFNGRVTLLTQDKDIRQCLRKNVNILLDVEWHEDETTGQAIADYKWVTESMHIDEGVSYNSTRVAGITPQQWPDFQAIAGDSVDGIAGVSGIGAKGAMDLILSHGSLAGVISAVKSGDTDLSEKKSAAVLEFAEQAKVTLALVTMRTDLQVPRTTAI